MENIINNIMLKYPEVGSNKRTVNGSDDILFPYGILLTCP